MSTALHRQDRHRGPELHPFHHCTPFPWSAILSLSRAASLCSIHCSLLVQQSAQQQVVLKTSAQSQKQSSTAEPSMPPHNVREWTSLAG